MALDKKLPFEIKTSANLIKWVKSENPLEFLSDSS